MIRTTPVAGYCGCCAAIRGLDLTDRLSEIRLPTLLIVGEDDPGTPVAAHEVIRDRVEGARLVVVRDAMHFSNVEQAEGLQRDPRRLPRGALSGAPGGFGPSVPRRPSAVGCPRAAARGHGAGLARAREGRGSGSVQGRPGGRRHSPGTSASPSTTSASGVSSKMAGGTRIFEWRAPPPRMTWLRSMNPRVHPEREVRRQPERGDPPTVMPVILSVSAAEAKETRREAMRFRTQRFTSRRVWARSAQATKRSPPVLALTRIRVDEVLGRVAVVRARRPRCRQGPGHQGSTS